MSAKSALDYIEEDFDYVRIPKNNILYWQMQDNSISRNVETEIRFVGEPFFEKIQLSSSNYTFGSSTVITDRISKITPYVDDNISSVEYGINKNMEGEKNMNKLLEIYKANEIEKIDDKYNELRKGIVQHDPLVQAAEEYNKKLEEYLEDKTLLIEYELNTERKVTIASQNILNDLEYKHEKEWEKLNDFLNIVEAHLNMADTFEEKEKILKAYNIIDETGKLKVNEETKNDVDFGKIEVEKQEPKKTKRMFRKE